MAHSGQEDRNPLTRVLIARLSGWSLELAVKLVSEQPDLQYAGQVSEGEDLAAALRVGIDVLLLGAEPGEAVRDLCSVLLGEYPHLKIVALDVAGDKMTLYWLGMRQQRIEHVSPPSLVKGIRRARLIQLSS